MNRTMADQDCRAPAECRGAKILLTVAVVATLVVGSATVADWGWRSRHQSRRTAAWIQALNLSAPALWTAGTPLRHPETTHPAVDLRFVAGIGSPP